MALRSWTPSFIGRWKALRPEMRPVPPARLLMMAVETASSKSLAPEAPPELIRPERPMKQLLDNVGLDGDAEVIGLAGEVGGDVIVLIFLEGVVAEIAPENRGHAEIV